LRTISLTLLKKTQVTHPVSKHLQKLEEITKIKFKQSSKKEKENLEREKQTNKKQKQANNEKK
jgi:O-acetylhomoserine/O-acetylserine sulfhydrylase-like pyridoxal-dependent enzyme